MISLCLADHSERSPAQASNSTKRWNFSHKIYIINFICLLWLMCCECVPLQPPFHMSCDSRQHFWMRCESSSESYLHMCVNVFGENKHICLCRASFLFRSNEFGGEMNGSHWGILPSTPWVAKVIKCMLLMKAFHLNFIQFKQSVVRTAPCCVCGRRFSVPDSSHSGSTKTVHLCSSRRTSYIWSMYFSIGNNLNFKRNPFQCTKMQMEIYWLE